MAITSGRIARLTPSIWMPSGCVAQSEATARTKYAESPASRMPLRHPARTMGLTRGVGVAWWNRAEQASESLPPANWFAAPDDAGRLRYWDGSAWTEHYAPRDVPVVQATARHRRCDPT
jgi:hypothetical protein